MTPVYKNIDGKGGSHPVNQQPARKTNQHSNHDDCDAIDQLKLALGKAYTVSDCLLIPIVAGNFKLVDGKLKCNNCHISSNSGLKCPSDSECTTEQPDGKLLRTKSFHNFKRSVWLHLETSEHLKSNSDDVIKLRLAKAAKTRNEIAGLVKNKDSYNSVEDRITAGFLTPVTYFGEQNHLDHLGR